MKIIKNYIYNTLYQIMAIIIPFITMPYLTRIFSPDQLGLNTYTLSIVNYFSLFGVLGMTMYGNRQIAYVRDDKENLRTTFWSLFFTKFITCSIAIIMYYLFIFFIGLENKTIYLIQGIYLFASLLDISWLYTGIEDFKKVVIRDSLTRIIGVILIFILVKTKDDLLLYIIIMAISNFGGTIFMWLYMPKEVKGVTIKKNIIKKNIRPLLSLFIPQISIQVYSLLSRTMIGTLSTNEQVSLYDYSQKIVQIVISIVSSMGVVIMPRVANIISNRGINEVKNIICKSFKYISYLAFPMCFGLMAVSSTFINWFLGTEFKEVGPLIAMSSIIIIAVSWANVLGVQYLIASNQERKYTISIVISAIVNVIFNIILIKHIGAFGACISLILAEYIGVIIQIILVKDDLPIFNMIFSVLKYFVISLVMYVSIILVTHSMNSNIFTNIIQVFIGVIIYVGILTILKDNVQIDIFEKIKILIFKNKF